MKPKESLNKCHGRHTGDNRYPVNNCFNWVSAFAGTTARRATRLIQRLPNTAQFSLITGKVVLALGIFIAPLVTAAPRFPAPPDATVGMLGDAMVVNGIPMHIRQFVSNKSVHDVLEYYRQYWPAGTEEKPGYTETDILTPWKIITRVEDGYLMTVQVTEQGDSGSHGLLGMSKLPNLENELPTLGRDFPKMRGSTVFNDITSKDIGKQGRTIQLSNTYSVESNANYYRDHYTNKGWIVDMDQTFSGGDSHAQRFSQGNINVIITINKSKNGSVIVAQTEKQGW